MAAAATGMSPAEMDLVRKCLRLLHSNHPDSVTELRMLIDEQIKQRYGPEKMLCNTLTKEQLAMERNFPGMVVPQPPAPPAIATTTAQASTGTLSSEGVGGDEVINLTNSPKTISVSDSPATIIDSDDEMIGTGCLIPASGEDATAMDDGIEGQVGDDDGNLKEFGDLNCCVCGEMMFTATNRLIECSKCGALYHQDCHKPPISEEEASESQVNDWQCDACFNKPSTSRAAGIVTPDATKLKSSATSSGSSSSSNSSPPFYKQDSTNIPQASGSITTTTTTNVMPAVPLNISSTSTTSSKHHHKSSRSKDRGSSSKNSASTVVSALVGASEKSSPSSTASSSSSSSKKQSSHSSSNKSSKSSKHDRRKK